MLQKKRQRCIDPSPKQRMHHDLIASRMISEPFHNDRPVVRKPSGYHNLTPQK